MSGPREEDEEHDIEQAPVSESGLRPVVTPPIRDRVVAGGEDEYEIVETDDAGQPVGGARQQEAPLSEEAAGTRPVIEQDRPQDGERRREPKSQRNARRREGRDRMATDNAQLRQQVEELLSRFGQFEQRVTGQVEPRLIELGEREIAGREAQVDRAIAESEKAARAARTAIAMAMTSGDTEALNAALDERDQAIIRGTRLQNDKAEIARLRARAPQGREAAAGQDGDDRRAPEQRQQQQQRGPAPLPARAQRFVEDFAGRHDWYDPRNDADPDSAVVLAIDRAVAREGYDMNSQEYWDEIEARMQEKLPWHFEEAGAAPAPRDRQDGRRPANERAPASQQASARAPAVTPQRRGPPTAGAGDRPAPGTRKQVVISPPRKQAMIDSGAIASDGTILDRGKYTRTLQRYEEFDRTNPR